MPGWSISTRSSRSLHHVTGPILTVTTTVDQRPVRAGVDPWHVLIDRTPSDNQRAVSLR